jgi:hypothetical protein
MTRICPEHVKPASDAALATWVESELTESFDELTAIVPGRFEAYARIFHPAATADGVPVRWADVAAAMGSEMHATVQWHRLVGSPDPDNFTGGRWDGEPPTRGCLSSEVFASLCACLADVTVDNDCCVFGLWESLRWGNPRTMQVFVSERSMPCEASAYDVQCPVIGLPAGAGRNYLLLEGPLSAVTEIHEYHGNRSFVPSSPNFMWPCSRTWFVASDIDLDSTVVGGSGKLVDRLMNVEQIEAAPLNIHDSLAVDA